MRFPRLLSLAAGVVMMIGGAAASAHHGRAAYSEDLVTVEATITEFRFINPHVQLYFDVAGEDDEVQKWQGELTAPNRLARGGWTKQTFSPGDKVTITGLAARNGGHSLLVREILLPDGQSVPLREVFD